MVTNTTSEMIMSLLSDYNLLIDSTLNITDSINKVDIFIESDIYVPLDFLNKLSDLLGKIYITVGESIYNKSTYMLITNLSY